MNIVGERERKTQNRVVDLFRNQLRACFKIHVPLILYFFIFSHQTFDSEIWSGCSYLNLAYKNFHIGL